MNPIEMSKEGLSAINHSYELVSYATPELRGLFINDRLGEIELRIIAFVNRRQQADPQELANHFKLTAESIFFCARQTGKGGQNHHGGQG